MASNYFSDYPDRVKQIQKYSGLEEIFAPLEEAFGDKSTYGSPKEALEILSGALDEVGKFCAQIQPHAAEIDRKGCKYENGEVIWPEQLVANMQKLGELGVYGAHVSRKYNGLNLPNAFLAMALEMVGQACPNTGLAAAAFTMAEFIQAFATDEQKDRIIPKMMTGEIRGSMALTEPQAGSDLGKLRTAAKLRDGKWYVTGTKMFISYGDQELSFVLARTEPDSEGLRGLSVLIVPRHVDGKDNFRVTKIEDKVCLHGSPTCELVFEDSGGEILGPQGDGFRVMSYLMNGARLFMAALSCGIAQGAVEEAKKYARERVTMGKPILHHPMVADMIFEAETEIRAMRAMIFEAAIAGDWMRIAQEKGDEKELKKWKKRYRRLTPLAKYFCTEKAITIAKNCVQIFGGYGVCKEYPIERLWRETIIYPIYEGTSQIQSLMVLKDTLKDVPSQATGFLGSLAGAWAESLVARDPVKAATLQARNELNLGIKTILGSIIKNKFKSDIDSLKQTNIQQFLNDFSLQLLSPKTDLSYPFLCAERFTRITCDYYLLKCMVDHCPADDDERRKHILEFAALALPRMRLENHYMIHRLPSTLDYLKTMEQA